MKLILFNHFFPINSSTIGFKRISSDEGMHGQTEFGIRPPSSIDIKQNRYVIVVYAQDWYIVLVEDVDKDKQECTI